MIEEHAQITVCICTYKRPALLCRALQGVKRQQTNGAFTFSVVVVDNDAAESARAETEAFARHSSVPTTYCVEPRQGIALARNRACAAATGGFVAFIDDDECPTEHWLLNLLQTLRRYQVDGVLGPVRPEFDYRAPRWVIQGGFYDRPTHETGTRLAWGQCRTGNVLLKRELVAGDATVFRPEFLSGEDQDFFKRQMAQGRTFVWCHEAPVDEFVPPGRWSRGFLVRRAVFRGVFSQRNRQESALPLLQSLLAVPFYLIALPIGLVAGQSRFMSYVFKLSYHAGRLLAAIGINPIKQQYVTDQP